MKFTCTKENLSQGLNLVSHIASKNTTLPILNNVLIKAEKGTITLTTTNLELGVSCQVRGKIDTEGSFTVQSKLLSDFVSLISTDTVDIALEEDTLSITSEHSNTNIKGSVADEFPLIPEILGDEPFTCDATDFQRALSQTLFSASNSETRPEISGVFMKFENGSLVLATTDSYRLAEKSFKCTGTESKQVIVPSRALSEVQRILTVLNVDSALEVETKEKIDNPVHIIFHDNQIKISYKNIDLVSRLIEGTYPDYEQIIPTDHKTKAVINVAEFIKAVKTASLFSRLGVFDVDLTFEKGKLIISGNNVQLGDSTIEVDADVEGGDNHILLNHKFLNDGLANLDGTVVVFEMNDESSPCILRPAERLEEKQIVAKPDYKYVIMPIKQ